MTDHRPRENLDRRDNMEKFWMVWKEKGSLPTVLHSTLEYAEKEAERLARLNPGEKFIVIESVKFCTIDNPVHWYETVEVPF